MTGPGVETLADLRSNQGLPVNAALVDRMNPSPSPSPDAAAAAAAGADPSQPRAFLRALYDAAVQRALPA